MYTTATFSYSQDNYTIIGEINYDMLNMIKFTARHIKEINTIFTGFIENVDIRLHHKIICAFSYNRYTIIEDLDNNKLTIKYNFYDDTTLDINLFNTIN